MRLIKRILVIAATVLVVGIAVLAVVVSYNAPCGSPGAAPQGERMRAVVSRCYGPPDVLKIETIAKPRIGDEQVLVKVRAAAVNPLDWHFMRGEPYVMRLSSGLGTPTDAGMGVDFAGDVEAVGKHVTRFKPGDAVFGGRGGALGEYVVVSQHRAIVHKPENVTFQQAAGVAIAAITALQALRDKGHVAAGQKVLINGASGGVGTFAVQIAKAMGAEVTGVCSSRNVELVHSLGADHVIDYTQRDFTQDEGRYDVIIDNVGNHSLRALRSVLKERGTVVMVGGQSTDRWLGPMWRPLKAAVLAPFVAEEFAFILGDMNQRDLGLLADMMREGKLTTAIDRQYPFEQAAEALAYLERGRARGKVIVNVQ